MPAVIAVVWLVCGVIGACIWNASSNEAGGEVPFAAAVGGPILLVMALAKMSRQGK